MAFWGGFSRFARRSQAPAGLPAPPEGYGRWIDDDAAYILDDNGARILLEVA